MMEESLGARRRYALCGLSSRGLRLFGVPLLGASGPNDAGVDLSAHGELVAIVDVDPERVARFNEQVSRPIACYLPGEFGRMVVETSPDAVLVASPDHTHAEYVVAALRSGVDVVTEKPLAASCEQVRSMLAAERDSAASIRVAHNVRYAPGSRRLKQMLLDGRVGRVTNVELVWNVDIWHGSSYFSRWNRQRGLFRRAVRAQVVPPPRPGQLAHRRRAGTGLRARRSALLRPGQSRPGMGWTTRCANRWSDAPTSGSGSRTARRRSTGFRDHGHPPTDCHTTCNTRPTSRGTSTTRRSTTTIRGADPSPQDRSITYYPIFGERQVLDVPPASGGHDGGDPLLQQDLFVEPSEESGRLGLAADSRQGAYAVAAGEAIWRSATDNRPYDVRELLGDFA